jgi:hypothetical protein
MAGVGDTRAAGAPARPCIGGCAGPALCRRVRRPGLVSAGAPARPCVGGAPALVSAVHRPLCRRVRRPLPVSRYRRVRRPLCRRCAGPALWQRGAGPCIGGAPALVSAVRRPVLRCARYSARECGAGSGALADSESERNGCSASRLSGSIIASESITICPSRSPSVRVSGALADSESERNGCSASRRGLRVAICPSRS